MKLCFLHLIQTRICHNCDDCCMPVALLKTVSAFSTLFYLFSFWFTVMIYCPNRPYDYFYMVYAWCGTTLNSYFWNCSIVYCNIHHVSKSSQNCFCHNFVKFPQTLIIFGTEMAKTIELCKMHSFTTLPNSCQRDAMWNIGAANFYITRWLFVSDCLPLPHQFDRSCHIV